MPTEDLQKNFSLLISNVHQRVFKPLGYKKVGQNLRLITPGMPVTKGRFVNFQKSQYNDAEELRFTMNVRIGYAHYPDTDPDNKYDHFAVRRPQQLSPKYEADQWWSITSETDLEALEEEIVAPTVSKA